MVKPGKVDGGYEDPRGNKAAKKSFAKKRVIKKLGKKRK